jgi:hypothetical protein
MPTPCTPFPSPPHPAHTHFPRPQLVRLDVLGPSDIAGWQAEGGRHFAQQQYGEAAHAYCRALSLACQAGSGLLPACEGGEQGGGVFCWQGGAACMRNRQLECGGLPECVMRSESDAS